MSKTDDELVDELKLVDGDGQTTLFSNDRERYVIPLYQRDYAWTDVEIGQLIDDIWEHQGEQPYYIGSLIVSSRDDKFEVIDGQQRLTTLLLLMIELGLSVKNILSFACRKKADDTLSKYIEGKEIPDEDLEQNLARGKRIIADKLSAEDIDKSDLKKKLEHVRLYRIQVPPHTDLNRYFEIMNTRGEQLEQHDILKERLMSAIDDAAKSLFAKIWEACSDMTGYVQMRFDKKTRELLFGEGWDWPRKIRWEDLAHVRAAGNEQEEVLLDDILDPNFKVSHENGGADKSEWARFESVIDFPHFLLHALRVYSDAHITRFPKEAGTQSLDDKKLIHEFERVRGEAKGRGIGEEAFSLSFIECLLRCRFFFDACIIKREYANEAADGVWSLKELAADARKNAYYRKTGFGGDTKSDDRNEEILMLQSALRVSYTSPQAMHWITGLLKWLYALKWPYVWNAPWDSYLPAIESIVVDAVKENFCAKKDRRMGIGTPHIVFNYLDFLLWREDRKKYGDFVFEFRNSVEHWHPRHPSEGTFDEWRQEEVDDFGNLCIIQRAVNSRFSNLSPVAKKATFEQMIKKGSLKLRLMADRTDGPTGWKGEYETFGTEMLEKLCAACGIDYPAEWQEKQEGPVSA